MTREAAPSSGDYTFNHADLSVFTGIAGILNSTGRYQGTLRDMTVDGQTETPDFQLSHTGHTMPLHTTFHARVDGTNGDTWLEPVDATLAGSHFTARGQVVRVLKTGDDGRLHSIGHDIALDVNVDRARIEDFLRLATDSPVPVLDGGIRSQGTSPHPARQGACGPAHRAEGSFRDGRCRIYQPAGAEANPRTEFARAGETQ